MNKIYVLHENREWVRPLWAALDRLELPYEEWFLDQGSVPFDEEPPEGVFYNRMSASSHTRGHRWGPELTHLVLNWLEAHGRRVVNDSRALYLELSKLAQYAALRRAGIATPRTVAAVGRAEVLEAARAFGGGRFILKPNRGGKGLGVRLFGSPEELAGYLDGPAYEEPIDGVWLVQEYVESADGSIVRCELVGGRFLYSVRVDATGGFELCPAESCALETAAGSAAPPPRFTIVHDLDRHPILRRYERFLRDNGIGIAGIELIVSSSGALVTYDVNTNTNYNAPAERRAGLSATGMEAIAGYLGDELARVSRRAAAERWPQVGLHPALAAEA